MLEAPLLGVLKLNVDSALFDKLQKAVVDAIFRDKVGNVIMVVGFMFYFSSLLDFSIGLANEWVQGQWCFWSLYRCFLRS